MIENKNAFMAKNNLSSKSLFECRGFYKDYSFDTKKDLPEPLDTYSQNMLYGRLDHQGDCVVPSPLYLDIVNEAGNKLIRPVAKAAQEMIESYNTKSNLYNFNSKVNLNNISIVSAHIDSLELYKKHIESFYKLFSLYSTKKIKNLYYFIEDILSVLYVQDKFSLSFSSFCASKYCSVDSTGLSFKISNTFLDDDSAKIDYIDDLYFDFYYETAQRFGFKIDKNAPWRLIADINSPQIKKYLSGGGLHSFQDQKNIFSLYYLKSYKYDIDLIKRYFLQMYEKIILLRGVDRQYVSKIQEEMKNLDLIYGEEFWLAILLKIKSVEYSKINNITIAP